MKEVKLDIYPNYDLAIAATIRDLELRDIYECVLGFASCVADEQLAMTATELHSLSAMIRAYYKVDHLTFAHNVHQVCMMGAKKYGLNDYLIKGISFKARVNSALRHICREASGETVDDESGYPQLFHTFANAAMIYEALLEAPENGNPSINDLKTEEVT